MIAFTRPTPDQMNQIQSREQSYYWSNCADLFFAKHGFLPRNLLSQSSPEAGDIEVVLRGARAQAAEDGLKIFEGPLDADELGQLGLRAKTWKSVEVHVFDAEKKPYGKLVYGTFLTKRIPTSSREKTEPQVYTDPDPLWRARPIRAQVFEFDDSKWTPILYAKFNDEWAPIALTDGRRIVLGVSLFDIIGFNHAMPAIDDGFYKAVRVWPLLLLERWLRDQILYMARSNGCSISLALEWPEGDRGCLSVRHDYDREISNDRLNEILNFYDQTGIKATWYLLEGKPPPKGQAEMMVKAGHEIALHTISPSFEAMRDEADRFVKRYGRRSAGFTCHGGIGSRGHLALNHNRWATELGMSYGEFIGRCRGYPHSLIDSIDGRPAIQPLMLQDCHHSLDLTTKPEDHQLIFLGQDIPRCLDRGEHVIIMNHPDIHWAELQELIRNLDTADTWLATQGQAAQWTAQMKYSSLIQQGEHDAVSV
ncbi:MAG: hypothetical protein JKY43_11765 [Phycisphaerales bacterium]|nr:hypothetical protein [Phycisphaerales bacterium]